MDKNKPMSEEQAGRQAVKIYNATKLKNPSPLQKSQFTSRIKGLCENCGFAYIGTIRLKDGVFPDIKCPNCHKMTQNFDEARAVDELNKVEGNTLGYKESVFKTVESK